MDSVKKIAGKEEIGKSSTPSILQWHPELYDSPLLDPGKLNKYQQLIGIGNWLVTIGRIDIAHAVGTLSRYSQTAREEHFKDAVRIFEYLNKFPGRGISIKDERLDLNNSEEQLTK